MAVDMSLWGVQNTGFYRPSVEDIKSAYAALVAEIMGEDVCTDEDTILGMFIRIWAAMDNKELEIAEQNYYSMFPHTSTGVSLDRHCDGIGLQRDGAGYAEHTLRVYGTQGYIIEAGTEFKNDDGVEFYSVMNAQITNEETGETSEDEEITTILYYADVIVQCKESGTVGNVNDINSLVGVDTKIDTVTWLSLEAYGTDAETDPQLREKYDNVAQGMGTGLKEAIIAECLKVSGVNNVIVLENMTTTDKVVSDALTVEAGTYAVVIQSDSTTNKEEIAQAILKTHPLGIPQSGVEQITVEDSSMTEHVMKFSYVATKEITVDVVCETDSSFTTSGTTEIQDNITEYINSLGIGESVIYSRLYGSIYNVTGVERVTSMTVNGGTADIEVNNIEIAKALSINVDTGTEG